MDTPTRDSLDRGLLDSARMGDAQAMDALLVAHRGDLVAFIEEFSEDGATISWLVSQTESFCRTHADQLPKARFGTWQRRLAHQSISGAFASILPS